jgi:hypothetical protein
MERLRSETFTAYLESNQRLDQAGKPAAGGTAFSLLNLLVAAPDQQMPLAYLMSASAMPFDAFSGAVKSLGDLG